MNTQRSPFSISKIELLVALAVIVATWFGLHADLWNSYPVGYPTNLPSPSWLLSAREKLFNTWIIPISIILALSSVFLVRGIGNQNIRHFSRLSHFALAWPLILFPLVNILYFFIGFCFPFGLILPAFSLFESFRSRKWWGRIFAIVWNIFCIIVAGYYFGHIDYIFGD